MRSTAGLVEASSVAGGRGPPALIGGSLLVLNLIRAGPRPRGQPFRFASGAPRYDSKVDADPIGDVANGDPEQ